jgi:predicted phosphohydrolase
MAYAVHTSYHMNSIPAKLSDKSVRFVCISDNHGWTFPVPDGDVLLHAGDLTDLGRIEEMERVAEWIYSLPHPVKVVIGGNHDVCSRYTS